MSIDVAHYQGSHEAFSQSLSSIFFRTESAALLVARRGGRQTTYHQAAERVISTINDRLDEPLLLQDMADIAQLSPYHFNRIFRQVTGIPPGKFQTALRLQAAKRLLVTTDISVTEICFMVGYNSLGTFTSHFTELVGLTPSQLRARSKDRAWDALPTFAAGDPRSDQVPTKGSGWTVQGKISSQALVSGPILIGLFSAPIPESQPIACTVVAESGFYQIHNVPRGEHYMLVAAFDQSCTGAAELLQDTPILVGKARHPIAAIKPRDAIKADVQLRPVQSIDPPILVALAQLLNERLKQMRGETRLDQLYAQALGGG